MRHLQTRRGTPSLAPRLLVLAAAFAVTLLLGASAPAAPNRAAADNIVNYPPPGSQIGIKGFDNQTYPGSTKKGYSQETKYPLTVACDTGWFINLRVTGPGAPAAGMGGQLSNNDIGARYNALTLHVWRAALPLKINIEGIGQCGAKPGETAPTPIRFTTSATIVDGPTVIAPGGPTPAKPPAAKPKSILSEKSKKTLGEAAVKLRSYAANASGASKVCVLGALKKEALKESLKVAAKDLAISYIPVIGDIPTDPCSAAFAAFTGIISLEADGFDKLAKDPPDPRFKTLVKPLIKIPVSYTSTQTPQVSKALNALTQNAAKAKTYQAAVLASIEKAQGAANAKNNDWEKKQNTAARTYAGQAAAALAQTPGLLRDLAAALKAVGYGSGSMTTAEAAAFQSEVRSRGLPKDVTANLTIFGVPRFGAQIKSDILKATPDQLAATSFPSILTDPGVSQSINSSAAVMRQLARG